METIIYVSEKRKSRKWPAGEWDNEPDKVQWQDEQTKMPCLAVRNHMGSWCGYVGVVKGHPWYQRGYDEPDVRVHGGLTFADHCSDKGNECESICHAPAPGESDDIWWFGFDCAHNQDLCPVLLMTSGQYGYTESGTYRTLEYVKEQCESLAKQLKEFQQYDLSNHGG